MTAIEYRLIPLERCLDDAIRFRNANRSLERDHAYFEWRYCARPCRTAALVAWAFERDVPVGAASIGAHDFAIDGTIYPLGVVGDISVAESHRGKGVARGMLAHVRERLPREFGGAFVLPNEAATGPLKQAGWRTVGHLRRAVRLLTAPVSAAAGGPRAALRGLLARTLNVCERVAALRIGKRSTLIELDRPDERFDGLWEASVRRCRTAGVRTSAYLRWRYFEHPTEHFRLLATTSGSLVRAYAIVQCEGAKLMIVDYLAGEKLAGLELGVELLRWAKAGNRFEQAQVRTFSRGDPIVPWVTLGFFQRPDTQPCMVAETNPAVGSIVADNWFLTAGDKDV